MILPCLDEAAALPWVLGRIPAGWRAIVVDNGSRDGSADLARSLGATVVEEPRRGFGAACHAGLLAATAELVCFLDCDGSLDPAQLPRVAAPVLAGTADLVLGGASPRRPPGPGRRTPGWPTPCWPMRLRARTGAPLHDLGPMRAARRERLLALGLGDRRSGYPLEMVLAASAAGMRIAETPVDYLPRTGRSKVTGTVRGTRQAVRDMRAVLAAPPTTLLVIAKSPAPGRVKTRLTPPCTPEQAAALAEAALADTLATLGRVPAGRRLLVLDGEAGSWLPPGWQVVPQRGGGLDVRLAAAFTHAAEATPEAPAAAGRHGHPAGGRGAARRAAVAAISGAGAPTPGTGRPPTAGSGRSGWPGRPGSWPGGCCWGCRCPRRRPGAPCSTV